LSTRLEQVADFSSKTELSLSLPFPRRSPTPMFMFQDLTAPKKYCSDESSADICRQRVLGQVGTPPN